MSSGILVSSPTTPRQLVQTLNFAVIDWHANLWSNIVGHQIAAPEFSVRFCRRRNCPNAAYLYVDCTDCTRKREGVEVKPSSLPLERRTNPSGLGLFATKDYNAGDYICSLSWNVTCASVSKEPISTDGPYIFQVGYNDNEPLYADVSKMWRGKQRAAGLARYCNATSRTKANVIFVKRSKHTWGT